MTRRHFPDFLKAYIDYAANEYAPEQFTRWTGLSVLAGALERKVWIAERGEYLSYPNLFVLLVGGPGTGKSSAIKQGAPLLYSLQKINTNFKISEGVCTSKALRDKMRYPDNIPGQADQFTSIYIIGSEGSDSPLKNHGDDFRSAACAMYDCGDLYQFSTGTDGAITIPQPCMNIIVGATYEFLSSVVDQESSEGGLASRFTYVIQKENELRGDFLDLEDGIPRETGNPETKRRLISDLQTIHRLVGTFRFEAAAVDLAKAWHHDLKEEFNSIESPRMKSLLVRKRTLFKKVMMLLSVSTSNDLSIRTSHVEETIPLVEEVTKDTSFVLVQAALGDKLSQNGTTQLISHLINKAGGKIHQTRLRAQALANGNGVDTISKTIDYMIGARWIDIDSAGNVKLLIDPDRHL